MRLGGALLVATAALAVAVPAAAAPPTTVVRVSMTEWGLRAAPASVPPGTVVFRIRNDGTIQHTFWIAGNKRRLSPGATLALRVSFRRPGVHRFLCTLNSHAAAGMRGALSIRPA
jgi:plastocyanin